MDAFEEGGVHVNPQGLGLHLVAQQPEDGELANEGGGDVGGGLYVLGRLTVLGVSE